MSKIARLKQVDIENFRGLRGERSLDVDADIVLVEGANGHGKTSLLEALVLLLTGWHAYRDPVRHLISQIPTQESGQEGVPESQCHLAADVTIDQDKAGRLELAWTKDEAVLVPEGGEIVDRFLPSPLGLPDSRLRPPVDAIKEKEAEQQPASKAVREAEEMDRGRELEAKLSAFFQDRLERHFDETASGATLRDVFEPRPTWLDHAVETLQALANDLIESEMEQAVWAGQDGTALQTRLKNHFALLAPLYGELLRGTTGDWPAFPAEATAEALGRFGSAAIATQSGRQPIAPEDFDLPRQFTAALVGDAGEIERQVRVAKQRTRVDLRGKEVDDLVRIEQDLAKIGQERQALRDDYPELEADLVAFEAQDAGQPDALAIFQALADNATRWSAVSAGPGDEARFLRARAELAAVLPVEAGKCAEALAVWLQPRRDARKRLDELAEKEKKLEKERERLLAAAEERRIRELGRKLREALERLEKDWAEEWRRLDFERRESWRNEAMDELELAAGAANWLVGQLNELTQPSPELMRRLCDSANWVLRRFAAVPGLVPLWLEDYDETIDERARRGYRIRAKDGRVLAHLSTGQRAQFAVALMVAQNREASDTLGHHVLLLDDVTTAYDLSNLSREALLWRQLAYGAEPPFKRQIFISSHHEDMTNHLLELLVPPEGNSMRLLRFGAWTQESGPNIEAFKVTPTGESSKDSPRVKQFLKDIQSELEAES